MGEPIRVLQVLGTTDLGGAESRVMDLYRNMDRERVQFDFAVHTEKKGFFDEEIETMGGRIYRMPRFLVYNWYAYRKAWRLFFSEHPDYACVHGHMTSTAAIYLPLASAAGVPRTVAHARSAGVDSGIKGVLTRLLRRSLYKKTEYCLAASALAGEAVFGRYAAAQGIVHVVPNAVQLQKYEYDPDKRAKMRARLSLEGKFTVGHVGRFSPMKNHGFLLEVFRAVCDRRPESVLLLLGTGSGIQEAKQKAQALGIADRVLFLGQKGNVQDYYQAMDFFLFPSLYEGLPGTVLEAQAAGLPCLLSDTITREVGVTDLVTYKSLSDGPQAWAEEVLNTVCAGAADSENGEERWEENRRTRLPQLRSAGFDAAAQAARWMDFYEKGDPIWEKENCC